MSRNEHVVIVGGGQAGGGAAQALREYGFEGAITLIADEAYPPYERPPLSKDVLLGKSDYKTTYLNTEAWYAKRDISLKLNTRITKIDRKNKVVITDKGKSIDYDKLLLATGGRVRRLQLPGSDSQGLHYLRGIDDLLALREELESAKRLVAIGGGFISLEIAAIARTLGVEVTLLEKMPSILDRVLEKDVAERIEVFHREKGVEFRTNVDIEAFVTEAETSNGSSAKKVTAVKLVDGELIPADVVVIGIGIIPNTELAEDAGLEVNNGIIVNEFCETGDTAIYACGDITNHFNPIFNVMRRLENWQNAQNQAAAVAQVMCGKRVAYEDVPWFWSDQYDMNLQMAGIIEGYDTVVVRTNVTTNAFSKVYLRDDQIIGAVSINAQNDIMAARKLIQKKASMDTALLADASMDLRKSVIK